MSAQIDQQDALTLRYLTTILANVVVLISADALVDRHLIQAHASVSVLNLYQSVLMLRGLTELHASVSVHIDHRDVPILRCLTMIPVNAVAPRYTDALVDSGSIQRHVNASVLNQGFHVLMIKNLMKLHVSVSAQIDHSDALTLRYLITILANVVVQGYFTAPEDRYSIQAHVNVNVPNQGQNAPLLRYLTIMHAGVFAQTNQQDVPIHRFLMIAFASVVALG